MRNQIIKGLMSVNAFSFTNEDVDRAFVRVVAAKANNPKNFAFTVGRNLGIDLNRRAVNAEKRRVIEEEKLRSESEKKEMMDKARKELLHLCGKLVARKPLAARRVCLLLDIEISGHSTEEVKAKYGMKTDAVYKNRQRAAEDAWPLASPNLRVQILKLKNRE